MKRREFVKILGGTAVTWPFAAQAQQAEKLRRVGALLPYSESDPRIAFYNAFKQRLRELGWIEGRNIQIVSRFTGGKVELIRRGADELVAAAPEVIFGNTNAGAAALKQATQSIPVVFAGVANPVGSGIVADLARPPGNLTGFQSLENAIGGKWVEVLREIAPGLRRVAFVYNPNEPVNVAMLSAAESAAAALGVALIPIPVRQAAEIEPALTAFAQADSGFIVAPQSVTTDSSELLIKLAERLRLPAIYSIDYIARQGGLVTYGTDILELYRSAAGYIDRILRGAKPGDLPVQLPVKYMMIVNLKTARDLGITVPPALVTRADEVIE